MGRIDDDFGMPRDERLAEDARWLESLADAAGDYETIGAEAAAEFGR